MRQRVIGWLAEEGIISVINVLRIHLMTLFCVLNLSLEYILSFCYKNEIIVPVLNVIKNCDLKLLYSPHNTINLIGF